jgi:DoxX-like family
MHVRAGAFGVIRIPSAYLGFRRCLSRSQLAAPLALLPLDYAGHRDRKHVRTGRRRREGHRVPDWRRFSLDTRVTGIADTPFKEILMKRKLNIALWIVAGILAVVFLVASSTKLFVPKEKLAGMGGAASRWAEDFSPGALKAIGALEFLAAVGLMVPAVLGIAPVLVPLAATGAVLLFAGAVIMRLRRSERATIIADLVYLAMAAFVAWGRFGPGSFTRLTQRGVFNRARLRRMIRGGLPDHGRLVP